MNKKTNLIGLDLIVEKNLLRCKLLWEKFSSHKTLWDEWDIVFSFFDSSINTPYFIVLMDKKIPKGLLPLMYESTSGRYMSFGGEYIENIHLWFPVNYFKQVWDFLPSKTCLYDINHLVFEELVKTFPEIKSNCTSSTNHHFLDLNLFSHDVNKFLLSFGKKHRKNMKYDINKIEELGCSVIWSNKILNYDDFVNFNKQRFGEESDFIDPIFTEGMKKFLLVLQQKNKLYTSTLTCKDKVIAVEYAAFHNGVYYVLNGGYDFSFKNVGKYMVFIHLLKANQLKADFIDFLSGDDPWKKLWNFQSSPYYTLKK